MTLGGFILLAAFVCVRVANAAWISTKPVYRLKLELAELEQKAQEQERQPQERELQGQGQKPQAGELQGQGQEPQEGELQAQGLEPQLPESGGIGIADMAVSGQRVVDYVLLEQQMMYELPDEELEVLLRIVEAEAGCEDEEGRLLVANVVLNRMNNELFPDTVTEVVFQEENGVSQFSPVSNGSYYQVEVSDATVSAVGRALMGEDISQGALYFAARKYADTEKMKWFDENLTRLFQYGGHEFFK